MAAEPKSGRGEYYRNNMILSVVVPVDMEKCYSVDAPGAQLQSIGTESVAVYMALPGEEGDFTIRMGTDDYESIGVLMMMVPGRLDALNHIKELKEAKDTWRESGDLMYESIDALLANTRSRVGDVSQVRDGVDYLERAREIVSQNRPAMESSASAALDELDHLTVWTAALVPYLQTARQAVTDINQNTVQMSNTMYELEGVLDDLYAHLGGLRDNLKKISGAVPGLSQEERNAIMEEIRVQVEEALGLLDRADGLLGKPGTEFRPHRGGVGDLKGEPLLRGERPFRPGGGRDGDAVGDGLLLDPGGGRRGVRGHE